MAQLVGNTDDFADSGYIFDVSPSHWVLINVAVSVRQLYNVI